MKALKKDLRPLLFGVIAFGLGPLMIFGGIYFFFTQNWPQFQHAKNSHSWPSTRGIIKEARTEVMSRKLRYYPKLFYVFEVGDESFSGTDSFAGSSRQDSSLEVAKRRIKRFKVGSEVEVFFKPSDPKVSLLEPGLKKVHYGDLVLCGIAVLIGGALSLLAIVKREKILKFIKLQSSLSL